MTHGRDLDRLFGDLGAIPALTVLSVLAGTVVTALFGPAFALLLLVDAARGSLFAPSTSLQAAANAFVVQLATAGVAGLLVPILLGLQRRGLHRFAKWIALLPVYLALASLATWQALFDLVRRPYSWSKTEHGTARHRGPP